MQAKVPKLNRVQFSLDRFYRINRRALIWLALFGLIYVLRDFFALIFITFLMVSFTLPAINYLVKNTRIPRNVIIVVMYLFLFAGLIGLVTYIVPRVVNEAITVAGQMNSIKRNVEQAIVDIGQNNPRLKPAVDYINAQRAAGFDGYIQRFQTEAQGYLRSAFVIAFTTVTTLLLSLLFAFLIVLDLARLRAEVRRLEHSRLHDFYEQSALPVVRFAGVIGEAFRAQAVIAVVNTILTSIGFIVIGLPQVALLALIVFFFSFVPVLGVFISTVPAVLVALNTQGYVGALKVIVFVIVIHGIEAYILNPLIYGRHLKLNPVLVLIILYVGHHFFGLWGMLLGVPVAYYFIHYVFAVPMAPGEQPATGLVGRSRRKRMRVTMPLNTPSERHTPDTPYSPGEQGPAT